MGNSTIDSSHTLKFIDTLQDRHFGDVDVFRHEDGRFVMRIKRTHIIGDIRHTFFKRVVEWVQQESCQFVVPIMHIRNQIERGLCIQFEVSEIYSEYFNFTLLDLLRTKKELEQPELWYIFEGLLALSTTLRKNKLAINLKADNVFITLKGVPCVYFHHFQPLEESIIYSQYSMGQQISIILMQLCTGEEISLIQDNSNKDLMLVLGKVCARYRVLGMALKELLNRQKNEEEMLQEVVKLFQSGKANKFTQIKLNKFRYAVPQQSNQKPPQKQASEPKKRMANNSPISFKPKKGADESKGMLKSQSSFINQPVLSKDELKMKQLELKKKLQDIAPKKQETEKMFDQLLKRKEMCQARMNSKTINTKESKDSFILEDKQNKVGKAVRKNSQPKKNRDRRLTQASKCSNYR